MVVWVRNAATWVTLVAAVLGGLSGTALGSWLSWRNVDRLAPGPVASTGIARAVVPVRLDGPSYYGRHTFWNPYSNHTLLGGTGVRVGAAQFSGTVPGTTSYKELAATVARRLRALAWRGVSSEDTNPGTRTAPPAHADVSGRRGGYLIHVEIAAGDSATPRRNPTRVTLSVVWDAPPDQPAWTVAGGAAGALLGAGLGLWSALRVRGRPLAVRAVHRVLCVLVLLMLAPACLGNIPTASGSLVANTGRDFAGPPVFWGGFVLFGAEPLAILSVTPVLAVLVLSAWPRRRRTTPLIPL